MVIGMLFSALVLAVFAASDYIIARKRNEQAKRITEKLKRSKPRRGDPFDNLI
tara:strand:- start:310 stop:468 length:159 start_codon:yes stop_codon:yes gene_type:complete